MFPTVTFAQGKKKKRKKKSYHAEQEWKLFHTVMGEPTNLFRRDAELGQLTPNFLLTLMP